MPFLEYVFLAILGSAPAAAPAPAGTSSGPPTRTLTADSVTQPSGGSPVAVAGIALVGQDTAGCHGRKVGGTGKKPVRHIESSRRPSTYPPDPVARVKSKRRRNLRVATRRNRGHHRQSKGVTEHDHTGDKSTTQKF